MIVAYCVKSDKIRLTCVL